MPGGLVSLTNRYRTISDGLISKPGFVSAGIPVGTLVLDTDFAAELLNEGFTFVASAVDSDLLAKATDNALSNVREKLK